MIRTLNSTRNAICIKDIMAEVLLLDREVME